MKLIGSVIVTLSALGLIKPDGVGPLSVLVVDPPADCACPGTVVGNYGTGGGLDCGSPPQPCFTIMDEKSDDADIIENGQCDLPGEPPCSKSDCVFPPWTVKMKVASCAGGNLCGTGPWQVYLPGGGKYGKPLNAGETIKVPITLANQACRSKTAYTLKLASSNASVEYVVEAKCGKCPRDGAPLPSDF